MAVNSQYSNTCRSAKADAMARLLDNGWLRIYDGAQPADANTPVSTQNVLAELRYGATSFPAAVNGVLTANALTADSDANATGTATWCRSFKSDGATAVVDGSVGTSAANLVMNSVAIQIHAAVSVSSLTFTDAAAGT